MKLDPLYLLFSSTSSASGSLTAAEVDLPTMEQQRNSHSAVAIHSSLDQGPASDKEIECTDSRVLAFRSGSRLQTAVETACGVRRLSLSASDRVFNFLFPALLCGSSIAACPRASFCNLSPHLQDPMADKRSAAELVLTEQAKELLSFTSFQFGVRSGQTNASQLRSICCVNAAPLSFAAAAEGRSRTMTIDPMSVLCLDNDILLQTLDYLSIKARVRFSRCSQAVDFVVRQSLESVTEVTSDDCIHGLDHAAVSAISRMRHLRVFASLTADPEANKVLADTLVNCCPNIREIKAHPSLVSAYVNGTSAVGCVQCLLMSRISLSGLVDKGQEVNLDFVYLSDEWDLSDLIQVLDICPQLWIEGKHDGYRWPMDPFFWTREEVAEHEDKIKSRMRCHSVFSSLLTIKSEELQKMLTMSQLKELNLDASVDVDRAILPSILSSFPLLQRLSIRMDFDDLAILNDAPQEWEGLCLTFVAKDAGSQESDGSEDGEAQDEPSFEWSKLTDFVDAHGHTLRSLELTFPPETKIPETLISQAYHSCSYLTMFQFCVTEGTNIMYHKRELSIEHYDSVSIRPLLTLFSKLRSIDIQAAGEGTNVQNWVAELRDFAASKRKYLVKAEIRSGDTETAESIRSIDSHLDLTIAGSE